MILPAILCCAVFELMPFTANTTEREENHASIAYIQPLARVAVFQSAKNDDFGFTVFHDCTPLRSPDAKSPHIVAAASSPICSS